MKRLFFIMLCMQFSLVGFSQIASAEYFFDVDPGYGNGTLLSISGETIDENISIPTQGLSDGVHKLYIRVLNDTGLWSLYAKKVIYVSSDILNSSQITSAEYFFDTDPGLGNGTALSVSGGEIDENISISTTGLSDGVHKLYIRVLNDSGGSWSLYAKKVIYVSPDILNSAFITSAEYFIDIDPGVGNATPIDVTDGGLLDEDLSLDVLTDLEEGDHLVYIRVLNENGVWSLYARSEVATLSNSEFALNTFKLYPNPVNDVLYLDTNNQVITDFKIIDFTGKVVYNAIPNNNEVNISRLAAGTYLVKVKTENGSISKKLLKK